MPANAAIAGRDDVRLVYTSAADGDFSPLTQSGRELESRRRGLVDLPWTQLAENHGTSVVSVDGPGAGDGHEGDVMITSVPGAVLGIWTGDCAPVCIVGERTVAAVHAGWRGLRDGVLDAAVNAIVRSGDRVRSAWVGPHIGPCCYEFGSVDLTMMTRRFGSRAAARDSAGRPALDVDACVRAGLERVVGRDVDVASIRHCTGCHGDGYFSHRVRRESGRQVTAVWIEETP